MTRTADVARRLWQQVEIEWQLKRRFLDSGMSEADWERDKHRLLEVYHRALASGPADDGDEAVRRAQSAAMEAVF